MIGFNYNKTNLDGNNKTNKKINQIAYSAMESNILTEIVQTHESDLRCARVNELMQFTTVQKSYNIFVIQLHVQ